MYGMINDAIRQMVTERHGEDAWEEMRRRADADLVFLRMAQYPDALTYRLVAIATEMLGTEVDAVLRAFGDYWIDYADEAYGELLAVSGDSFVEMVENLNDLHTRVGQLMPDLKPPSFHLTEQSAGSFRLHYHSTRDGLGPMVVGLLEGLGRRYRTAVEVEHVVRRDAADDHDEFLVRYRPA
ncbi:MAG TPA: heme NO-binding domain-containing protein [Gammaproteobacteria bacterium]